MKAIYRSIDDSMHEQPASSLPSNEDELWKEVIEHVVVGWYNDRMRYTKNISEELKSKFSITRKCGKEMTLEEAQKTYGKNQ